MTPHISYIGLGSNLSKPTEQLREALSALSKLEQTQLTQCSSFYASKPMGPQDQPDYVNAVAEIHTQLTAFELLEALQKIEHEQGRQRKNQHWGPRTLDLDILLFDQQQINSTLLTVPHYGMKEREFVLYPLHEINPQLLLPCGNSLISVLNNISRNGLQIIQQDVTWE
ncbi:2-amino-4-hydroxy-6-hydroxymethyldihydropteridine diphosphokinase [Aliiglaciecola sp. LCG003]|uniref:2-amino-4-hydroxy-6- hydroxymethyldihydropteridine diphosphokinase n=1 Tax=Aliiglaciecola sp. LCG003 TaxID=3053655 RepID=UPI0025734D3C|nr:2-amino-4-hydroxy-6-hydroxymethyldihydropteridine diphosphokinase [Aliiglaciecola sp. LCG003]WJG09145.1 2-amino-4-hydroxy-6-hydroxymethyldihydropteridine diphosphokinase [Aliiglaciecola sp. LCG003]